jgi:RHS repeat-associated protein
LIDQAGVVSVSHYSDGSDNPGWVTQTGGPDVVSELYTASLGSGLGVFTKVVSGLASASVQLVDVRGNTVTSFDVGSKTVSGWGCFDAFGNPETQVDRSGLLGYGAYGQMQRSTSSSGLLLMGVRVYNPVTNQFTSVDAVVGGNETPYGYPNDPVNKNDFSGLWMSVNDTIDLVFFLVSTALCVLWSPIACLGVSLLAGAISESLKTVFELVKRGKHWTYILLRAIDSFYYGMKNGLLGWVIGAGAMKILMRSSLIRDAIKNVYRKIIFEFLLGGATNRLLESIPRKTKP